MFCRYRLKEFVVSWFGHNAFASHAYEWPALEIGVLLLFALFIALSKLARWLRTRKREANESQDEGQREYWRTH
jgi:membrane protein implicated in regulation of membrane protease activity